MREYPEAVFYYLKIFVKEEAPILDLGCRTGISTRQLVLNGFQDVQGVDPDEEMLNIAREKGIYKYIPYWRAEASLLPFRGQFFQAITCFSSFHLFADEESLAEIRRILKPKGVLFIVQKNDISPFKEEVKKLIEEKRGAKFPSISVNIEEVLRKNHFVLEPTRSFEAEDLYSLHEALEYIQSTSFWAAIEEEEKIPLLDQVVKPYLETRLEISKREQGRIIHRYEALCLIAHKS